MTLQAFVAPTTDLSQVVLLSENEARPVAAGSDKFCSYWEGVKGRRRITVTAKAGETIEQIGRKYQVSPAMMERINHRSRGEALRAGGSRRRPHASARKPAASDGGERRAGREPGRRDAYARRRHDGSGRSGNGHGRRCAAAVAVDRVVARASRRDGRRRLPRLARASAARTRICS